MKRNILLTALILSLLAVPANADLAVLERGLTSGRIIYSVSDSAYLSKSGKALTESSIAKLSSSDYSKTGLVADGNTRLILRYQSESAGSVTFSVSPEIAGSRLERFTNRQLITAPVESAKVGDIYQASAVFVAPETWPSTLAYPKAEFTVTASFTPSDGGQSASESKTLTLQAPPVVLIHGAFSNNEDAFGYGKGTKSGVWHKLKSADLTVTGWNYHNKKGPKELIANNSNGLAKTIADTLNNLNAGGIAATRVDLVTHSSGGLIARQYLRNDIDTGNKTANSYGLGTVRRVVTIASPNLGTPIASYLAGKFEELPSSWQNWTAKSWWQNVGYTLIKALALRDYDVNGMLDDLRLKSSFIAGLGYPGVPFHSIYGKIKSDNDKINQLFDDVVNQNIVGLQQIDWLPEQTVDMLTSSRLALISGVLKGISDDIRFKELLGALFGDDDYDLIVSESSAKDIFPSNAVTSFEGLGTHNHIMIARQNDTGERVLALLKGGTDSFMTNTASTSEYDAAFDTAVTSYGEYLRASEGDSSEYLDSSLTINATDPKNEYMGSDDDEPTIQSVKISGVSTSAFSDDVYVVIKDSSGVAGFFRTDQWNGKNSFDVDLWADSQNKGVIEVSYLTVQDEKLKMSPSKTIVFAPVLYDKVTEISFSNGGKIYGSAGDEVHIGLIAHTADGDYDISSPLFGLVSYKLSDSVSASESSIAEITDEGSVKFLKEGSVTITASAYGKTASASVSIVPSQTEEDTTADIEGGTTSGDKNIGTSSSSGGCNAGLGALILLSAISIFMKRSR